MVRRTRQTDVWGDEPAQAPVEALYRSTQVPRGKKNEGFKTRSEERLGLVVLLAAAAWGIQLLYNGTAIFQGLTLVPGPVHVAGVGALIWLHAKWRRAVRIA